MPEIHLLRWLLRAPIGAECDNQTGLARDRIRRKHGLCGNVADIFHRAIGLLLHDPEVAGGHMSEAAREIRARGLVAYLEYTLVARRIKVIQTDYAQRQQCQAMGQHLVEDDGRVLANDNAGVRGIRQISAKSYGPSV